MAVDPMGNSALALHRFGVGPRPNSIRAIARDPQGALLAELERPDAGRVAGDGDLPGSDAVAREFHQEQIQRLKARRIGQQSQQRDGSPNETGGRNIVDTTPLGRMVASGADSDPSMRSINGLEPKRNPSKQNKFYSDEVSARIKMALTAEIGIVERLVWFWSNHFCISTAKPALRGMAGGYEREAIRKHVLGQFADMLFAVETHPAMLYYLDNWQSTGPNSFAGRHQRRGLNENLAREILELHTLGVRSVYTQNDVTNFAKVITGWTIVPLRREERGGQFEFAPNRHEPGPQTVIGKSYPDGGLEQGRAVLRDLARHPATATHIAKKLAMHFVADAPPSSLVERIARRFLDTDGNLKEVTRTLLQSHESWEAPRTKLKRPSEWLIGALRIASVTEPHVGMTMRAQSILGEPLWRPSSPKGFSDESATWIDGLSDRLDVANNLARYFQAAENPSVVLEHALGPLASDETKSTVARAEDRKQALALLFMAPEFLQR